MPLSCLAHDLTGRLRCAPKTDNLEEFTPGDICPDRVRVEGFCGFVFVNLDPEAVPLAEQAGDLGAEILHWAPLMWNA